LTPGKINTLKDKQKCLFKRLEKKRVERFEHLCFLSLAFFASWRFKIKI